MIKIFIVCDALFSGVPLEDWTCKACQPVQTAAIKTDATISLRQSPDFYNVFEFFQRFGELKGLDIEPVSMLVRGVIIEKDYQAGVTCRNSCRRLNRVLSAAVHLS